jgi:hypothetical protein
MLVVAEIHHFWLITPRNLPEHLTIKMSIFYFLCYQ